MAELKTVLQNLFGKRVHAEEQKFEFLPSSQSSPGSTILFGQAGIQVQTDGSPVHYHPFSIVQEEEQPSMLSVSSSSHSSEPLIFPSPHIPSQSEGVPEQLQ